MVTRYFDFFKKLFEAKEEDKSSELAESFIMKIYKARLLKNNKENAKKKKLAEEPNISEEELKRYINNIKVTTEEEKKLKEIAILDPFYLRINNLCTEEKKWNIVFLPLFFQHFKNSNPNVEKDNSLITQLLGEYEINLKNKQLGLEIDDLSWAQDGGIIGNIIKELSKNKPDFISKIFAKLPEISKIQNIQKIDLNKITDDSFKQLVKDILPLGTKLDTPEDISAAKELLNTSKYKRPGYEILTDLIRDTKEDESLNYLINQLPKGVVNSDKPELNRQNLYEEYKKLKDDDKLITDFSGYDLNNDDIQQLKGVTKKDLTKLLREFITLLSSREIPMERTESKTREGRYPYEKIFKIKLGTVEDKQIDKNLFDFYLRLNKSLIAASNANIENLDKCVAKAKKKFGEDSVEVIWRDQKRPKAVLNIKNHKANEYLNGKNGELTPTKLCIAWAEDTHWRTHIEKTKSKLYFVYNFDLVSTSNLLPIGIAIGPNGMVSSAFDKNDENGEGKFNVSMTQNQVESHLNDFGIPYEVLEPISEDELTDREIRENALQILIRFNVNIELLKKALDTGIDPNVNNCQAMINAINENDIAKVKLLINNGARIDKLGVDKKNVFSYTKSIEMIKFFIEIKLDNGADINSLFLELISIFGQNTEQILSIIKFLSEKDLKITKVGLVDNLVQTMTPERNIVNDKQFIDNSLDIIKLQPSLYNYIEEFIDFSLDNKFYDYSVKLVVLCASKNPKLFKKIIIKLVNEMKSMSKDQFTKNDLIRQVIVNLKENNIALDADNRSFLLNIIDTDYKAIKSKLGIVK